MSICLTIIIMHVYLKVVGTEYIMNACGIDKKQEWPKYRTLENFMLKYNEMRLIPIS